MEVALTFFVTSNRQTRIILCKLKTTDYRLPTLYYLLQTTDYQLFTTYYLLLTPYLLPLTSSYLNIALNKSFPLAYRSRAKSNIIPAVWAYSRNFSFGFRLVIIS
jgi:hypothetical protein